MNALDPNKIQLCRLGEHNEEAQCMGQPCGCVGNCQLGRGQVMDEMPHPWRVEVRMRTAFGAIIWRTNCTRATLEGALNRCALLRGLETRIRAN
jgi:hypothetical protein